MLETSQVENLKKMYDTQLGLCFGIIENLVQTIFWTEEKTVKNLTSLSIHFIAIY